MLDYGDLGMVKSDPALSTALDQADLITIWESEPIMCTALISAIDFHGTYSQITVPRIAAEVTIYHQYMVILILLSDRRLKDQLCPFLQLWYSYHYYHVNMSLNLKFSKLNKNKISSCIVIG